MTDSVKYLDRADPVLRWYHKQDEKPVGESVLEKITLAELQKLVGESADNPMVDCDPLSATQASLLQKPIGQAVEPGRFDYVLECDVV